MPAVIAETDRARVLVLKSLWMRRFIEFPLDDVLNNDNGAKSLLRPLLERKGFIEKALDAIEKIKDISNQYPETGILLGVPYASKKSVGRGLYNSAILIYVITSYSIHYTKLYEDRACMN